jgi:hypothetical protein
VSDNANRIVNRKIRRFMTLTLVNDIGSGLRTHMREQQHIAN